MFQDSKGISWFNRASTEITSNLHSPIRNIANRCIGYYYECDLLSRHGLRHNLSRYDVIYNDAVLNFESL